MSNEMVTAEQLMKRDLTAVMAEDTVEDAMHVLHSHSLSGVPVVDERWRLVGFLSESDILRSVLPSYLEILVQDSFLYGEHELLTKKFSQVRAGVVRDYMQTNCQSVKTTANIMNVADLMLRLRVKRLPVLDGRLLVGIIDRSDLCEYLMNSGGAS
ncbi:CBS domain-containing protein [Pyramidobacter sp.]|uniref:CBS domain-containing protein n=1 Tax=Pyramidobacter sp. TaxID=1943581 RepID=UPI0025E51E8D|nr:CBS domain-containing protein [Pyramidobacter sp.]MCI7402948.1 CBS domain-containing protein [Pyramidobacter sp.]MDY3211398.1 CBS domain-containing protein [Pyramidobacter sp.]